jgi:hypothetical protein
VSARAWARSTVRCTPLTPCSHTRSVLVDRECTFFFRIFCLFCGNHLTGQPGKHDLKFHFRSNSFSSQR